MQSPMVQKALAILLAVSWIVLSGVDMLEDLEVESRDSPSASSSPSTAKPVKLSTDQVQLASRALERLFRSSDLEKSIFTKLAASSLESGAVRSYKDNCVFLI
jgi:hypothetical protein